MRTYQPLALAVALAAASSTFGQQDLPTVPLVPPSHTIQNPKSDLPPVSRTSPPTAAELPKMSGTWSIVSGERRGERLPDERIRGLRVTIDADTITVFDRGNKPFFVVRYTLDTARTPNEINMKMAEGPHAGEVAKGIVTMLSAEELRLCYSTGNQGRPAEFRTFPGGSNATLFILKRSATEVLYAGEWQVVDAEVNGKKLPAEEINRTKVMLTRATLVLTDDYAKNDFVASYKTFTAKTPNMIDMTVLEGPDKGKPALGIIEPLGADRLKLCFSVGGQMRPEHFRTTEGGPPQYCYILARLPSPIGVQPGTTHIPPPQPSSPSGSPPGNTIPGKPPGP